MYVRRVAYIHLHLDDDVVTFKYNDTHIDVSIYTYYIRNNFISDALIAIPMNCTRTNVPFTTIGFNVVLK